MKESVAISRSLLTEKDDQKFDTLLPKALEVARQTAARHDITCSGYPVIVAALLKKKRVKTVLGILENEPLSLVDRAIVWRLLWEKVASVYDSAPDESFTLPPVLFFFHSYCHYWSQWYTEVFDIPPVDGEPISLDVFIRDADSDLKDRHAIRFETSADKGVEFFVRHGYGETLYTSIAELSCFPFMREELIERLVEHGDIDLACRIAETITDSITERQAAFQILGVSPSP